MPVSPSAQTLRPLALVFALAACASDPVEEPPEASLPVPEFASGDVARWGGWLPVTTTEASAATLRQAWILVVSGEREVAIDVLTVGLRENPAAPELFEARAALHANLGFLRAAERDLDAALAIDSSRANAWQALGRVRVDLELPLAAGEALRNARSLGAEGVEFELLLARAYDVGGARADALAAYARAFELDTELPAGALVDAAAFVLAGVDAAAREQELIWARTLVERALATDETSSDAWFLSGYLLEESGADEAAAVAYRRACELDPRSREAWTNLALVAERLALHPEARAAAIRADSLEGDRVRKRLLARLGARNAATAP